MGSFCNVLVHGTGLSLDAGAWVSRAVDSPWRLIKFRQSPNAESRRAAEPARRGSANPGGDQDPRFATRILTRILRARAASDSGDPRQGPGRLAGRAAGDPEQGPPSVQAASCDPDPLAGQSPPAG